MKKAYCVFEGFSEESRNIRTKLPYGRFVLNLL